MFRRRRALLIAMLVVPLAGSVAVATAWRVSVTFREQTLLACLASGVHPLQRACAKALRDYPSPHAALGLVAFVNLQYRPPVDTRNLERVLVRADMDRASEADLLEATRILSQFDCWPEERDPTELRETSDQERKGLSECLEERHRIWEEERRRDAKLAERALLSLCILTGHDFGTYYEKTRTGYSWGSLSDERWSRSLGELNFWAARTFVADALADGLAGLLADPAVPSTFLADAAPQEPRLVGTEGLVRTEGPSRIQPSRAPEPTIPAEGESALMDWSGYGFGSED